MSKKLEKNQVKLAKQALKKCQKTAVKVGLSKMTLDEINIEIQAVRNTKNNS